MTARIRCSGQVRNYVTENERFSGKCLLGMNAQPRSLEETKAWQGSFGQVGLARLAVRGANFSSFDLLRLATYEGRTLLEYLRGTTAL